MTIRGLAFPFNKDSTSFPAKSEDDTTVEDNIKRIVQTRRWERVMRPEAGSDVMSFVFESAGPLLSAKIDREVRRAIAVGEPRVQILRVTVGRRKNKSADALELVVVISYRFLGDRSQTVVAL